MATSRNHVDRLLPWMLEVIDAFALLDEVDWSLSHQLFNVVDGAPGQMALRWHILLSTPSPLLGQQLTASLLIDDIFPSEYLFKSTILELLNGLAQQRQMVLGMTIPTDPNGD